MALRAEIEEIKASKALSVKTIEAAIKMLKNSPQLFDNGDFDQKVKILGLLIPEKMIISKTECQTKKQNVVIELLTRVNKGYKKLGTKKAIISDGLSTLAPPNIVLSNHFNEELMKFASLYESNVISIVP